MTEIWADYSGGRPSGAALRAAGFTGVIRYIGGGSAGKRLTVAEAHDLIGAGVQVRCVFEIGTTDASGGYQAGVNNATAARNDPAYLALPAGTIIYAANDRNESSATSVAYAQGFADTLGATRTGVYGFGVYLNACRSLSSVGLASYWQAGPAPSRTGTDDLAEFWQRQATAGSAKDGPATPTTMVVGGVVVDINNRVNPAKGTVIEMELTDQVPVPNLDTNGNYAGDGAPAAVADLLRFSDASVRWLIEKWVPAVNSALAAIAASVAALQTAQVGTVDPGPYTLVKENPPAS
jgi:hypothetical protein